MFLYSFGVTPAHLKKARVKEDAFSYPGIRLISSNFSSVLFKIPGL